jgi:hypothetical protein
MKGREEKLVKLALLLAAALVAHPAAAVELPPAGAYAQVRIPLTFPSLEEEDDDPFSAYAEIDTGPASGTGNALCGLSGSHRSFQNAETAGVFVVGDRVETTCIGVRHFTLTSNILPAGTIVNIDVDVLYSGQVGPDGNVTTRLIVESYADSLASSDTAYNGMYGLGPTGSRSTGNVDASEYGPDPTGANAIQLLDTETVPVKAVVGEDFAVEVTLTGRVDVLGSVLLETDVTVPTGAVLDLEITEVPEPSASLSVAVATACLAYLRRKRAPAASSGRRSPSSPRAGPRRPLRAG